MIVVVYFGGRGTLWANFDDYRIWRAENTYASMS